MAETKTKWTPGPWFVVHDEREGMEWNRHICWDQAGDHRIAFMASDAGTEANAHLIAAAPALYEALEKIVADAPEAHEPYPAGGQSSADDEYERGASNQHFYLANIARAALALAEGKQ
jgi:hypothetical protein